MTLMPNEGQKSMFPIIDSLRKQIEMLEKENKELKQQVKNNVDLGCVIGSAYNERPKDRPNCPNCKKQLSPAGGSLDGKEMFWTCWDCGYEQEDIPSHSL